MNQARVEFPVTLVIAKEGDLCWLGHLDFMRAVERAMRKGGLPLRFTEGFHPRVKMRLPEPLPLGVGSDGERFVVPLAEEWTPQRVSGAIAGGFPRGLRLVAALPGSHPEPLDVAVELELEATSRDDLAAAIAALPAEMPAIGGAWALVSAAAPLAEGARAAVKLAPRPGGRVSAGRFLELLKQGAPPAFALLRVHRRVAWQGERSSLPSSPLPPGPAAAEEPAG